MSKYEEVIKRVFHEKYEPGDVRVSFTRNDLVDAHDELDLPRAKNIGDIPYSFRFRRELPDSILKTAPQDSEWIIVGTGIAEYQFRLSKPGKILPTLFHHPIKIPDATPEIVKQYAPGTDEQALLTRVRYNRLIDVFTGLTCYSIQNHLRTTVPNIGQIEVDEIYAGLNERGKHYVLPCQAKSQGDSFGIVQVLQDIALCEDKYPYAYCRPIALQFVSENKVAVLELSVREENDILEFNIVNERHYILVPQSEISENDLRDLKDSS